MDCSHITSSFEEGERSAWNEKLRERMEKDEDGDWRKIRVMMGRRSGQWPKF